MRGGISRRGAIRTVATLALAPALVPGAIASAADRRIAPPAGEMLFTRRLRREMTGGFAIVVTRGFAVRFRQHADGFRIEGEQVAVEVDAPPNLAAIAEIERQRVETGMFPTDLDSAGLILASPGGARAPELDRAVDRALAEIRAHVAGESGRREMGAFILALQQAAGTISASAPADLFVPPALPREIARDVPLPDGSTGHVVTVFSGSVAPESGLMAAAERSVVTEAGDSSRRTVESWSLAPHG